LLFLPYRNIANLFGTPMPAEPSIQARMKSLKVCVIIPTYNNAGTLMSVIEKVEQFTDDILVVNDGSTDGTSELVGKWASGQVDFLTISENRGKGMALRKGFERAIELGYRYAITIDSDGQHDPLEIPKFIDKIEGNPDAMIVGARDMSHDGVPGTSSFGHKFSIFWFKVETGLKIPDVQSGYRLYPLHRIDEIRHFYGTKYEFEVEVLVRLAWRGVSILSVPVTVWYAPKGERVSHFRKGTDFARTTLLNTILVFAALLWVRPFHFAKGLRGKSFKQIIREYLINSSDSNSKLAWSVVLGLFIGVSPFWGYQMVVAVSLAHLLKLNKFIALVASNISLPPLIPVILFLSYITGGLVLGTDTSSLEYSSSISFEWIKDNLIQYVVGSFVFGAVFAPLSGLVIYILLLIFRKKEQREILTEEQQNRLNPGLNTKEIKEEENPLTKP
jgi:glycosyltransferase involved in cell wall biosynthesis